MTKAERVKQIELAAKLEDIIEQIDNAARQINHKERTRILYEQITALHIIIGDIVKDGTRG